MRKIVIDPRVIKHLGRDLITSPEVAIIELIKNSIDAKASHINLRLYNSMPSNELIPDCVSDSVPNKYLASPILVVEDDGCGMTDATIDGGFLKIATDIKSNEESTLGEKGIGRLAAQRLGTALLVETSSDKENHTSYVFIDWNAVINGVVDIPSCDGPNTLHHTRLFIFNANLEDYIDNATQFKQVSLDTTAFQVQVNRELKSALNFLITPFADAQDTLFIPQIKFYFDEHEVDITFPYDTLALAESIHNFRFEPTEDGMLNYGLNIKPWFIERVHRALVKAEAFKRLKKPHSFYRDILERNSTRIENALKATATKDELVSLFYNILCDFYAVAEDEDKKSIFDSFIEKKALSAIEELLKIAPITGSIYSFKQGAAIGDKIVIDAAYDLGETSKRYSLKELKYFLEDYNGIKLYRDIFRIGFLGNKESDWIKLQQFRTKGQQWYRFDLGNTVGYVSLADAGQNHIQEISSRLDISANETSEAFKLLINVVFNYLFYDLNRKANDLVKTLLAEEGLLEENLSKRVKKNDAALREMMRRNKRMQKALADVSEHLRRGTQISGTDQVALPQQSYAFLTDTVRKLDADIKEDSSVQESTAVLLSEADAQLKAIEVESYNNYILSENRAQSLRIYTDFSADTQNLFSDDIGQAAPEHAIVCIIDNYLSGSNRAKEVIQVISDRNTGMRRNIIGSIFSSKEMYEEITDALYFEYVSKEHPEQLKSCIAKSAYNYFISELKSETLLGMGDAFDKAIKNKGIAFFLAQKARTEGASEYEIINDWIRLLSTAPRKDADTIKRMIRLSRVINSLEDDEDLPDADLQQLNTLEAFDYTVNDYFLPVTAGDIFTNSKDEWFVLIGQDCDMARSITRTPKDALAELLPAKVRTQTDFEKWTNDLRSASIYSFRKNLDAGCEVLQVEYQKREYIANEILNLCSFNSTGECKISLSDSIGQEQHMLMPDYMVEYYSKLQQFFLATKTLRIQAEDAFEIVLSKEHSPRLLSFKDFDKTSDTVSFDLKRVCRLTHDYVFYLYKLYLEYRGRQPFQTINLIRQEDTSLPVMYNKEKTGQYLSFRSIPIPDKSNRKNWCWVIDAAELNRVLMLLKLPTLRDGNDDIVLKNECVILQLQQDKQIQIVKAKEKVHFKSN